MRDPGSDPIFTVIGEFQARQVLAAHAPSERRDAEHASAEAALLSARATTRDGLHAGMCFRIELLSTLLQEAENEAEELMWPILRMAAEGQPVARALAAMFAVVEPGFCTTLLQAALHDALELEQGGGGAAHDKQAGLADLPAT